MQSELNCARYNI